MPTQRDILILMLLPGVIAVLAASLAWRPSRRQAKNPGWLVALALAGGPVLAGILFLKLHLPPHEAFDWLRLEPALALAVGLIVAFIPRLPGFILVAVGGIISGGLLFGHRPDGAVEMTQLVMIAIAPGLLYVVLEPLARRSPGPGLPAVILVVAIGTTIVESASDSAVFGQYTIALCAATGGLLLACMLVRPDLSRGGLAAFLLIWIPVLAFGELWVGGVPHWRTAVLAVAPLAAWAAEVRWIRNSRPLVRMSVRIAAVAIPVLAAAIPAAKELHDLIKSQSEIET